MNTHSVNVPVHAPDQATVQHKEKCSEKCRDKFSQKYVYTSPAGEEFVFVEKEGRDQPEKEES